MHRFPRSDPPTSNTGASLKDFEFFFGACYTLAAQLLRRAIPGKGSMLFCTGAEIHVEFRVPCGNGTLAVSLCGGLTQAKETIGWSSYCCVALYGSPVGRMSGLFRLCLAKPFVQPSYRAGLQRSCIFFSQLCCELFSQNPALVQSCYTLEDLAPSSWQLQSILRPKFQAMSSMWAFVFIFYVAFTCLHWTCRAMLTVYLGRAKSSA